MVDLRQRGLSDNDGTGLSYGVNERLDVLAAVGLLRGPGYRCDRVAVVGMSAGAAASLSSLQHDDHGIDAVVSISTFSSLYDLIVDKMEAVDVPLLQRILGSRRTGAIVAKAMAALTTLRLHRVIAWGVVAGVGGSSFQVTPSTGVASSDVPIFFVHGSDDSLIPARHQSSLVDVCSSSGSANRQCWSHVVRGAPHNLETLWTCPEFRTKLVQFLRATL